MEPELNLSSLEKLGAQLKEAYQIPTTPIRIITAPTLESLFATALVCRALLRSGTRFHVTFCGPAVNHVTLATLTKSPPSYSTILIGLTIYSNSDKNTNLHTPLALGCTDYSNLKAVLIDASVISGALAFSNMLCAIKPADLCIAAQGILVSPTSPQQSLDSEIVKFAFENNLLRKKDEFLFYGVNFLPLEKCLEYSIRPFLDGISGNSEACINLLEVADIPLTKRGSPLSQLSTKEKQRLATTLITLQDTETIGELLGYDIENPSEQAGSPLRWLASVRGLGLTAWARSEHGLALSVWMGDRARLLRLLLDAHIMHCKNTLSVMDTALEQISNSLPDVKDGTVHIHLPTSNLAVLSDVGRILLKKMELSEHRFLIFSSKSGISITWHYGDYELELVEKHFLDAGLVPIATSYDSLVLKSVRDTDSVIGILTQL